MVSKIFFWGHPKDVTESLCFCLAPGKNSTEVPGVSREVPCSTLKGETVLDTLDATAKVPRHAGFANAGAAGVAGLTFLGQEGPLE